MIAEPTNATYRLLPPRAEKDEVPTLRPRVPRLVVADYATMPGHNTATTCSGISFRGSFR
jgi:hypothetical protein